MFALVNFVIFVFSFILFAAVGLIIDVVRGLIWLAVTFLALICLLFHGIGIVATKTINLLTGKGQA